MLRIPEPKKAETMLKAELEDFLASLREIALSCGGRNADSREIQLVRRELAARDQRISSLEQTLQKREETRLLMEQEQQSLLKQLDDARILVQRVEATRAAQLAAQDRARKVLAGSPSAQELEHELEELQAAEDFFRKAREARRGAAVRRKVAIEAELEAGKAHKPPVAKKTSPPSNPSAPPVAVLPPAPSPPAAQRVASPAPPPVPPPQARSPAAPPKAPVPPPAAVTSPAARPKAPPPVREVEGEEEEGLMETGEVETSAAVTAVEAALLAVAPRLVAPAEDDDDFDTMGWPATQPKTPLGAAGTEADDDDDERNLPDLAHLRAEAGAAARPAQAATAAMTSPPAAKTPSPAKTPPPASPAKTPPPASPPTAQLQASPPVLAAAGFPPPLVVTAKCKASEELDGLENEEIWSYGDSDESGSEFESEEDPSQATAGSPKGPLLRPPLGPSQATAGRASAPADNVIVREAQKHAEQQRQAQMRAEEQARAAAAALKMAAQKAEAAKDAAEHAHEKLAQAKQAEAAKATSKKVTRPRLGFFRFGRKKGAEAHDEEEGGSNVSALEAEVQRLEQIARSASEAKEGAQVGEVEARRHAEAAAKDAAEAETRVVAASAAAQGPAPLPPVVAAPPPAAAKKPPAAAPIEVQQPQPLGPPTASPAAPAPPSPAKQAVPTNEALRVPKVAPVPSAPPVVGATPVDEGQDEDSEDSDYDLDAGEEPTGKPVLKDLLLMAKLYGYEGSGTAPPEKIDWSLRSVALHEDAIWHADIEPPQGENEAMVGRIDLEGVSACDFTIGRIDELFLSQQGKCHLLRIDPRSTTTILQWRESILQLL